MHHVSDLNFHEGRAQVFSLCFSLCVSSHVLYSFLLMNTYFASLLSVFVEALFCKAEGQGPLLPTTGHSSDPVQSLARNPSLASRCCRLRPPEITGIPRTVACQSPLSMQFSGQEYLSFLEHVWLGRSPGFGNERYVVWAGPRLLP